MVKSERRLLAEEFWRWALVAAFVWYFAGFWWAVVPLLGAGWTAFKCDAAEGAPVSGNG